MNPALLVKYGCEAARIIPALYKPYKSEIRLALLGENTTLDEVAQEYFKRINSTSVAKGFAGYLGLKISDILTEGFEVDRERRLNVGKNSIILFSLNDIADNILDRDLDENDEREKFLESVFNATFRGLNGISYQDTRYRSAMAHARAFYKVPEGKVNVEKVYERLIKLVIGQFGINDPEKALKHGEALGATCLDIIVALNKDITGITNTLRREAIMHLGSYGQILDDLVDIDEDLSQGSATFPTLYIKHEGDSAYSRREIKRIMLAKANKHLEEGSSLLDSPKSQEIFHALADLLILKHYIYDFIVRITKSPLKSKLLTATDVKASI